MHVGGLSINGKSAISSNGLMEGKGESDANIVLFDLSKEEAYTPNKDFKTLHRRLKKNFQVKINKDDLTEETLRGVRAIIMGAPTSKFELSEIKCIKGFIHDGGSVLIMAQEGGESKPNSQISKLTSEFGIKINNDCVVRTAYRKDYFHPKEVYIAKASLTPQIDNYSGKMVKNDFSLDANDDADDEETSGGGMLDIVYPFGATLSIERPATPLITSGKMSFPANRALVASAKLNKGLMIVMGSARPFIDKYVGKEDNSAFMNGCVSMLTSNDVKVGVVENDRPEFKQAIQVPDMEALAERLRCCLQETEELPSDFTSLFEHKLFDYNTDLIPEADKLYQRLNIKNEPLSLIAPQFEVPLPPLQPAVFLPCMRELPPPALDLFDLDQEFSGETVQLAQLTNKCSNKDLDYYVKNAGQVLNVTSKVNANGKEASAKQILEYIFKQLVNYKKMDTDSPVVESKGEQKTTSLISPSPREDSKLFFKESPAGVKNRGQ